MTNCIESSDPSRHLAKIVEIGTEYMWMYGKLPKPGILASMSIEELAKLMQKASRLSSQKAVERITADESKRLDDLPNLLASLHKEKKMGTGQANDEVHKKVQ